MASEDDLNRVRGLLRDVPDFPKPGITFRDITPVLADADVLGAALRLQLDAIAPLREQIGAVCGIESRGFLFGISIAMALGVGFFPARKPGRLPAATHGEKYGLEYGEDELHVHVDAIEPGTRVLIVDDLLATGGTAAAAARLVERLGGSVVGSVFLIELAELGGRAKLTQEGVRVDSVIVYD